MKLTYTITLYSDFHCSSGQSGFDKDILVIRDENKLPFLPGKTAKGLFKDAAQLLVELGVFEHITDTWLTECFGTGGDEEQEESNKINKPGRCRFDNAELPAKHSAALLVNKEYIHHLYTGHSSTAIDNYGVAKSKSLRTMETTVPLVLKGEISNATDVDKKHLFECAKLIRRLGTKRNRGYGRCMVEIEEKMPESTPPENTRNENTAGNKDEKSTDNSNQPKQNGFTRLHFTCNFLTDVVLSEHVATKSAHTCLDYVPGTNFLGILADKMYNQDDTNLDLCYTLFHSGKVRFSDGHLMISNTRSNKIPAVWQAVKGSKLDGSDEIYIDYAMTPKKFDELNATGKKLNRLKSGYFVQDNDKVVLSFPAKNYRQKSAHDRFERRSKEAAMFGFESLKRGTQWGFYVDVDDEEITKNEEIIKTIIENITGDKQIGRTKNVEYGKVRITPQEPLNAGQQSASGKQQAAGQTNPNTLALYVESPLIFYNEYGQPTIQPTEKQLLGIDNNDDICIIDWQNSRVSPRVFTVHNGKRRNFDFERVVIEKGSVIFVNFTNGTQEETIKIIQTHISKGVGEFRNEGFGQISINPSFLTANKETLQYETTDYHYQPKANGTSGNDTLIQFLEIKKKEHNDRTTIFKEIEKFKTEHKSSYLFRPVSASQWGTIRAKIHQFDKIRDFMDDVFDEEKGFLFTGAAGKKWQDDAKEKFKDWINNVKRDENVNEELQFVAIDMLAAEMQKSNN